MDQRHRKININNEMLSAFFAADEIGQRTKDREANRNQQYVTPEFSGLNYGKSNLPRSNLVPSHLAIQATGLPHSQVKAQQLAQIAPLDVQLLPQDKHAVQLTPMTKTEVEIPLIRTSELTNNDLICLLLYAITPFYQKELTQDKINPSHYEMIKGFVSIYASIDTNITAEAVNASIKTADIHVTFKILDSFKAFVAYLVPEKKDNNNPFKCVNNQFSDWKILDRKSLLVLFGVIMLTLGKHLTPEGYDSWFVNRLSASAAVVIGSDLEKLRPIKPDLDAMLLSYKIFSGVFPFRRLFITRMFGYARMESAFGKVIQLVMKLLAFTDMAYVVNIDKYLLEMMPELLNTQLLRSMEPQLIDMVAFCQKHKDYLAYVRFLVSPEECNAINRNVLRNLNCAATAIAMKCQESFKNYRGGDQQSPLYRDLFSLITRYMSQRNDVAVVGLVHSARANIAQIEQDMITANELLTISKDKPITTPSLIDDGFGCN